MPGEKKKKSTNIQINGTLISDEKEIANKFNYHFIETVNRRIVRRLAAIQHR